MSFSLPAHLSVRRSPERPRRRLAHGWRVWWRLALADRLA
jgi:hypothetical protein